MHTLKYGDVIQSGHNKAMFICYEWDYAGPIEGRKRPGQHVIIVSDAPPHMFSFRMGQKVLVNWLGMDGSEPPSLRVKS